jgi:hypothetical protein
VQHAMAGVGGCGGGRGSRGRGRRSGGGGAAQLPGGHAHGARPAPHQDQARRPIVPVPLPEHLISTSSVADPDPG